MLFVHFVSFKAGDVFSFYLYTSLSFLFFLFFSSHDNWPLPGLLLLLWCMVSFRRGKPVHYCDTFTVEPKSNQHTSPLVFSRPTSSLISVSGSAREPFTQDNPFLTLSRQGLISDSPPRTFWRYFFYQGFCLFLNECFKKIKNKLLFLSVPLQACL